MVTFIITNTILGVTYLSLIQRLHDPSVDYITSSLDPILITHEEKISVFYNVYTASESDLPRVQNITEEQLALFDSSRYDVFVRTINVPIKLSSKTKNATLLVHEEEGDEVGTLGLLWDFCKRNSKDKVVYIHSKGSFHPHNENNKLRRFLTRGAASQECANLPNTCNVCSSRMSPFPHPHTSGNMWLARCNYVTKLIDPRIFEAEMTRVYPNYEIFGSNNPDFGTGRFAAEHWIYSHPDATPCDLSDEETFIWGYSNIPDDDFKIDLKFVPRFSFKVYAGSEGEYDVNKKMWMYRGISILMVRENEYKQLYNMSPSANWYGWHLYGPDILYIE